VMAPYTPEELLPGPKVNSDEELKNAARDLGTTIFHPVGTCQMGKVNTDGSADNSMTVLDSDCRLRGITKLRVVDASVMPTITSGNTNAPVMFIAENVSKKILRKN